MNPIDRLTRLFESFPGVGARQARRYAFHVLRLPSHEATELGQLIGDVRASVRECASCYRYFTTGAGQVGDEQAMCSICLDNNRNRARLLVVERDTDVTAIERAGAYDGLYFVLGGTVPLLSDATHDHIRSGKLKSTVRARRDNDQLAEVILGFSVNPDGENTGRFVESILREFADEGLSVSYLGRGLSTGSELEYADAETIKNALTHRS
jgi:recombination protein RecR